MHRVVVLGAGFAGLTIAEELEPLVAAGEAAVTLIDRSAYFSMGFSMQWAFAGRRTLEEGRRPYASMRSQHVTFIQEEIINIDTGKKIVRAAGQHVPYDELVIALGAELTPQIIPGLADTSFNLCDATSVMQWKTALSSFAKGTILISISSVPFKCPPSPYEYAFLVEDLLRKRGMRDTARVIVTTPEPQPMPVAGKEIGAKMVALLLERNIEFLADHKPAHVDTVHRAVVYEHGVSMPFDMLAAMPPHRAPQVARDAGLTNPAGFIPVDLLTLRTAVPGVYAVGDVAAIILPNGKPHPKAGVFAEAQARTVARNIVARLHREREELYTGEAACFIDTGKEQAAAIEAHVLAEGGPHFAFQDPSVRGLSAKAEFESEHLIRWFGR